MVAVGKAHILPGFAFVFAFQQPDAGIRRARGVHLARANPNGAVLPIYRHAAHVLCRAAVHYGCKGSTVIVCMPKSAAGVAYIKLDGIGWVYGKIYHPAAHYSRANAFKGQVFNSRNLCQFCFLCNAACNTICGSSWLLRKSYCCSQAKHRKEKFVHGNGFEKMKVLKWGGFCNDLI